MRNIFIVDVLRRDVKHLVEHHRGLRRESVVAQMLLVAEDVCLDIGDWLTVVAARRNPMNSGCGLLSLLLNSGWYCTPT